MNMEMTGNLSSIVGLITFLFSIGAWFYSWQVDKRMKQQLAKQEEKIDIRLSDGQREIVVGHPRRKWLSRQELNGLLGLLSMKPRAIDGKENEIQPRYAFTSFDGDAMIKKIEGVQDGATQLVLNCSPKELDQFADETIQDIAHSAD